VMLVTDRWSGYMWDFYFTGDRDSQAIITALTQPSALAKALPCPLYALSLPRPAFALPPLFID
jgi:hypothetical protein